MTQFISKVKVLSFKPGDLSSVPGTRIVEGENQFLPASCPLTSIMYTIEHDLPQNKENVKKMFLKNKLDGI